MMARRCTAALFGGTLLLLAAAAFPADQEGCLLCHRLPLLSATEKGGRSLEVADPAGGPHGSLYCSDCHPDARTIPHGAPPGPSTCIGECHGTSAGAAPAHRRAAFGGLTETHRGATSPRPPCLACHESGDGKGAVRPIDARCVACHGKEARSVRKGPHWRMGGSAGRCAGCHPAHPQGVPGKSPARCDGPECHARTTSGMRAIVDHRTDESPVRALAKAGIILAFAAVSWGLAGMTRPRGPGGRPPE
jgi:predicted CxxxxCH...CXXCH cytochrome family protein